MILRTPYFFLELDGPGSIPISLIRACYYKGNLSVAPRLLHYLCELLIITDSKTSTSIWKHEGVPFAVSFDVVALSEQLVLLVRLAADQVRG